jgi:hypothetical protein
LAQIIESRLGHIPGIDPAIVCSAGTLHELANLRSGVIAVLDAFERASSAIDSDPYLEAVRARYPARPHCHRP